MKYHKQKHLAVYNVDGTQSKFGSCYPTAYACLLDLELDEVPNFHLMYWTLKQKENLSTYFQNRYLDGQHITEFNGEEYKRTNFNHMTSLSLNLWDNVRFMWLASMGYEEVMIKDINEWLEDNGDVPYMVSGLSSRGTTHVVIYKDGIPLHDPHPSGEFLVEITKEYPYSYLKPFPKNNV